MKVYQTSLYQFYMANHYFINQTLWFHQETYIFNAKNPDSKQTSGTIKGIKKYNKYTKLYLIEFLNHNRIWIIEEEIQKKLFYKK